MTPRRVIEDSDEDDGSFGTPELLNPFPAIIEVGSVPKMQPSSTDSLLSQAVYEEHLGQLLVDDQLPSHGQSPTFDDPIIDQRMSSSASVPSARRLKRSKTMNTSSHSSITEPNLSNRKAKRTESMMGPDDLTQITTPRKSNDTTRKDSWEVPTSSASDGLLDVNAKVTSRSAERKNPLKTYGRQIRRTQTLEHTIRNTSSAPSLPSPQKDDIIQASKGYRSEQNEEDHDLPIPKSNRQKIRPFLTAKSQEPDRTEQGDTIDKDGFPLSSGGKSTCVTLMPIQIQRFASVQADLVKKKIAAIDRQDFSSLSLTTQSNPDGIVENYVLTKSSEAQVSGTSLRSIVVIPNTLSDNQKLQYETVSVASTARSRQSSPSAIQDMIDSKTQCAEDSLPELPPETLGDKAPVILLLSSPPVAAMNRKMNRAKSEVSSKRLPTTTTIDHHHKVVKRKGRSKTVAQGEMPSYREASVDELSLTSAELERKAVLRDGSTRNGKKRAYSEDEHELSTTKLHTLGATDLNDEQYQACPSQTRARSTFAIASNDVNDLHLPRPKVHRKRSLKPLDTQSDYGSGHVQLSTDTPVQSTTIQDTSAMVTSLSARDITSGSVQLNDNLIFDRIGNGPALPEKRADVPAIETVPTVPTEPKKRGRKKTSEIVAVKSSGVSKTQTASIVSKENEAHRKALHEMDGNKPPLQDIASTPPTKASVEAITIITPPAQTPIKDSKRGPDQHSPLQSGKVPYRVGLSKKTRIAPLLKMIKK